MMIKESSYHGMQHCWAYEENIIISIPSYLNMIYEKAKIEIRVEFSWPSIEDLNIFHYLVAKPEEKSKIENLTIILININETLMTSKYLNMALVGLNKIGCPVKIIGDKKYFEVVDSCIKDKPNITFIY